MNSIERYLAQAADVRKVISGQDIRIKVDLVIAHDVTAPMAVDQFERIGVEKVFDPNKIVFIIDHIIPAATVNARKAHRKLTEFSLKYGSQIYNKGEGVIHQVVAEENLVQRGQVVIGADSHTCTAGAYGAIAIPVGSTELAATMATGTLDLEVPAVDLIYLKERPALEISAKDIILNLIGKFGTGGFTDRGVIFAGPGFSSLSKAEKMTICNMCIEMGVMIAYMAEEGEEVGETDNVYILDSKEFERVLACPHSPGNVKPAKELEGLKVSQVVVGSCTNGRIEDMRIAAAVVKGKHVHPEVTMIVVPASKRVLEQMEAEGLTKVFRDANALVTSPGCGPCFGAHMGLASSDDVIISTTNRNFPGRMGDKEAQIYLASPELAAQAAVWGSVVTIKRGEEM